MNITNRRLFAALAIIVIIAVVLLNLDYINDAKYDSLSETSSHASASDSERIKKATFFSSTSDGAYIYLALGVQANQLNCQSSIESLVKFGGWNGPIYLITDRLNCFGRQSIVQNAKMNNSNLRIVSVDEDFGLGGIDFEHPKIGLRKNRYRSFGMKSRLFDYVNDSSINVLAYVDCDILFGIPGCATEFISEGPSWGNVSLKVSKLHRHDSGKLKGMHAGTLVLHRNYSKRAMSLWHEQMEKFSNKGDNDAYITAFNAQEVLIDATMSQSTNSSTPLRQTRPVNPMEVGLIQTADTPKYEEFYRPDEQLLCMTHISKARCQANGRTQVQTFVDRFKLRTYGKHWYCPNSLLFPLLYGSLPVSYVPYCPKLEWFF